MQTPLDDQLLNHTKKNNFFILVGIMRSALVLGLIYIFITNCNLFWAKKDSPYFYVGLAFGALITILPLYYHCIQAFFELTKNEKQFKKRILRWLAIFINLLFCYTPIRNFSKIEHLSNIDLFTLLINILLIASFVLLIIVDLWYNVRRIPR